ETQFARLDLFEQLDCALEDEVVAQEQAAELGAGLFDAAGRGGFVGTAEHWGFAHLHEGHAGGVVDLRFAAAFLWRVFGVGLGLEMCVVRGDEVVVRDCVAVVMVAAVAIHFAVLVRLAVGLGDDFLSVLASHLGVALAVYLSMAFAVNFSMALSIHWLIWAGTS